MEDTKSLLMMVLHKIFQNQPKIVENTFQLIHNYNNGKVDKKEYEQILKNICDLMNDKLPSQILIYLLTLVNMPQEIESQSTIVEKMRKTRDCLPEINARPHLLEYLNNIKPSSNSKASKTLNQLNQHHKMARKRSKTQSSQNNHLQILTSSSLSDDDFFIKPKIPKITSNNKTTNKTAAPVALGVKSLLDICASYVVNNEQSLKEMYLSKEMRARKQTGSNGDDKDIADWRDRVLDDVNKKIKLLKEIESNRIDELVCEYREDDAVFRKCHLKCDGMEADPFQLPDEVEAAIDLFRSANLNTDGDAKKC